jgi:hypothetical protein
VEFSIFKKKHTAENILETVHSNAKFTGKTDSVRESMQGCALSDDILRDWFWGNMVFCTGYIAHFIETGPVGTSTTCRRRRSTAVKSTIAPTTSGDVQRTKRDWKAGPQKSPMRIYSGE